MNGWETADHLVESAEDELVIVGAMIENRSAVDAIDEILSIPELRFVRVGYNDLAVSIGCAGEYDHPEVRRLGEKVEAEARDHEIPLSGKAIGREAVDESIANGYRLITLGNDLSVLRSIFSEPV